MNTPLAFIATCDLVAQVRGRSLAAKGLFNSGKTVGWVPADLAMTSLGMIADPCPFGSYGDLRLSPIEQSRAMFQNSSTKSNSSVADLEFYLAHQVNPDGSIWECDPRQPMIDALNKLKSEFNLELVASFEHEFTLFKAIESGFANLDGGIPFGFDSFRIVEEFGSQLVSCATQMGLEPENWLPEYGSGQFEITVKPARADLAADRAIILRELIRDLARKNSLKASLSPLISTSGVGNGVHVHLSLKQNGKNITFDPGMPANLGAQMAKACAGILKHSDSVLTWSAPSQISFLRLVPHRWSAGVAELAIQNREAMLRICPVNTAKGNDPSESFNVEFRATDATANPWLVIAVLANAMLEGLRADKEPIRILDGEFDEAANLVQMPSNLAEAIKGFEADAIAQSWFSKKLSSTHLAIRESEKQALSGLTDDQKCIRYVDAY